MTKGQQAMVLAMIYPEPERGGRGNKSALGKGSDSEPFLFSKARLSDARSVLRHSRVLAESVVKGAVSLDDALAQVD
jgi:hypothetical protein